MTTTADFPDFVRPVATTETDARIFTDQILTGALTYDLGTYDVSQVGVIYGNLTLSGLGSPLVALTFDWKSGTDVLAEDRIISNGGGQFGSAQFWAIRPKSGTVTITATVNTAASNLTVPMWTSTRTMLGNGLLIGQFAPPGKLLAAFTGQAIPAGGTFSWTIPPVARSINIWCEQGSGPGSLTLIADFLNTGGWQSFTVGKWFLSGTTELDVQDWPVMPNSHTITIKNTDTVSRNFSLAVTDAS